MHHYVYVYIINNVLIQVQPMSEKGEEREYKLHANVSLDISRIYKLYCNISNNFKGNVITRD